MKKIDKVALIYVKDGKVLTTLSKGKDTYYMPGGKRELGESDNETLIREIKEELSVDVIEDTIKFYGTFEAQAEGKAEGIEQNLLENMLMSKNLIYLNNYDMLYGRI